MRVEDNPGNGDSALLARLARFAQTGEAGEELLPWVEQLSLSDRNRLRSDLSVVLAEPDATGEPLDWGEIGEIFQEWAEAAGWEDLLIRGAEPAVDGPFGVVMQARDKETLARASPAVRKAMDLLTREFLPAYPTSPHLLPRGRLKKLRERDAWQVQLPDGYRLRYVVDKRERRVHIVYFGPHPDRDERGRERAVQVRLKQRPFEGFKEGEI
jgi:hypothetical protein